MPNLWFISDTHFNHANILKFVNYDDLKVRPEFDDVNEMNETMIERWNSCIQPNDKVYHLGDVAFGRVEDFHKVMKRLNGKKRLILGNHDNFFNIKVYAEYFEKILSEWRPTSQIVFSHRPLFIGKEDPKLKMNVHGHVHRTISEMSPQHMNISVEMTDYYPISKEGLEHKIEMKIGTKLKGL